MADIIIAPMTSGQVEAVAAIEKECFSTPWSNKAFSDAVESELYAYITAIAGEDGTVAGYAGMQVVLDGDYQHCCCCTIQKERHCG